MTSEAKSDEKQQEMDRSIGFLINDVSRLLRRGFTRRMKSLGLTGSQWLVLAILYHRDGQAQTELAAELDMERAPLGRIVDRLEVNGWVKRQSDRDDRRINRVYLTGKLEPLVDDLRQAVDDLYGVAFKDVPIEELDRMADILQAAKNNLL